MLSTLESFSERLKWFVDEIRKEVRISDSKIAAALDIDRSYLSTLKRGLKGVPPMDADIWSSHLVRGGINVEWLRDGKGEPELNMDNIRKTLTAVVLLSEDYRDEPSPEQKCREYFEKFLAQCDRDQARLGWTLIELRKHFPLNMWEPRADDPRPLPPMIPGVSSVEVSDAARKLAASAASKVLKESSPRSSTDETSAKKHAPKQGAEKG